MLHPRAGRLIRSPSPRRSNPTWNHECGRPSRPYVRVNPDRGGMIEQRVRPHCHSPLFGAQACKAAKAPTACFPQWIWCKNDQCQMDSSIRPSAMRSEPTLMSL